MCVYCTANEKMNDTGNTAPFILGNSTRQVYYVLEHYSRSPSNKAFSIYVTGIQYFFNQDSRTFM